MTLHPRSIQARLLVLLIGLAACVWIGAGIMTLRDTSDELDELLDGHLAQSAALLIAQQAGHGPENLPGKSDPVDDAPSLHKYAPKVAFQVFHDGQLTLSSANAGGRPMSTKTRGFETVRFADGNKWRVFGAQGDEGDVQVFVGEQIASRDSILWAVLKGVMLPMLYSLPLLGAVGWLAVRRGMQPLRALSQALARRQPQELDPVVLPTPPTELQPVLDALNALFERIGSMVVAERRFTADAAHELRTPIAALRMQAQVALGAREEPERRAALNQTLQGCDRATHLVEQLLTLSRLEGSNVVPPRSVLSLDGLCQRVAADLALVALGRGQDLSLEVDAPVHIHANDALAGVLVRNLIDNALRYSPDDGHVQVRVGRDGAMAVLTVSDDGPGLTDDQMQRLGERFFRVLGTERTGSGLGWSIVRRIAAVYNAEVAIEHASPNGLRVSVRWPLADTPKI